MWRQIVAVTQMNLANLRSRVGASAIIVVGMAGVVAVLLGLLAMSSGFRAVLAETARPDRVLIVRNVSNNEMSGWVTADELGLIRSLDGVAVASGEVYVIGFAKSDGARDLSTASEEMTLQIHPQPESDYTTLVTIPYSRIRQHRQYAAPNQDGFTVTVRP